MLERLSETLQQLTWFEATLIWLALFVVTFLGSIAVVAWVLVALPADYFHENHYAAFLWADRHPLLRWTAIVAKNLLGVVLVLLGIVMSLPGVPGQGILTILIGIMLLDFPGKRRMERSLVSRPSVRRSIDRLRGRFGKPPLTLGETPLTLGEIERGPTRT